MKQKLKAIIGHKIEDMLIEKYNLNKATSQEWDAEDDKRIFEIKAVMLKQSKRTGRAFINLKSHQDLLLKCPEGKSPFYLIAIYYLIDVVEPVIISTKIAEWALINSLNY